MADKSQAIAPGWIPLWNYRRAFSVNGTRYDVVATMYALSLLSRVYRDGSLVDEQQLYFAFGYHNLLHELPLSGEDSLRIELGFFNWVNVGIRASTTDGWVYESHPDKDIGFMQDHPLMAAAGSSDADAQRKQKERWNRNKPSIYADISLGLLFFAVGKLTGDLVQAALIGAAAGLALVVAQRFVKVDLLGGFAVFGTIMLLISAGFSLAF